MNSRRDAESAENLRTPRLCVIKQKTSNNSVIKKNPAATGSFLFFTCL
jgi:hypothetical protein